MFYMPDNNYVRMPLEVALGHLTDTIVNNTSVQNKKVPNPVNSISGVYGESYIDIQLLSDLAIKAYHTNHRLSDDKMNFPREKTQDNQAERVSNVLITDVIGEFDNSWGTRRIGETIFKYKLVFGNMLSVGYDANSGVITYVSFGGWKKDSREPYPAVIEKLKVILSCMDSEIDVIQAFEEARIEQGKRSKK